MQAPGRCKGAPLWEGMPNPVEAAPWWPEFLEAKDQASLRALADRFEVTPAMLAVSSM